MKLNLTGIKGNELGKERIVTNEELSDYIKMWQKDNRLVPFVAANRIYQNKNGNTVGYTLVDVRSNDTRDVETLEIKNLINNGKLAVVNLSVTSDNRLISKGLKVKLPKKTKANRVDNKAEELEKVYQYVVETYFFGVVNSYEEKALKKIIKQTLDSKGPNEKVNYLKVISNHYFRDKETYDNYKELVKPELEDTGIYEGKDEGILVTLYILMKIKELEELYAEYEKADEGIPEELAESVIKKRTAKKFASYFKPVEIFGEMVDPRGPIKSTVSVENSGTSINYKQLRKELEKKKGDMCKYTRKKAYQAQRKKEDEERNRPPTDKEIIKDIYIRFEMEYPEYIASLPGGKREALDIIKKIYPECKETGGDRQIYPTGHPNYKKTGDTYDDIKAELLSRYQGEHYEDDVADAKTNKLEREFWIKYKDKLKGTGYENDDYFVSELIWEMYWDYTERGETLTIDIVYEALISSDEEYD